MEKNTTNYKFLNAKDRASERKNSHGILDTDRYHYKTAPHVQTGKRKRDNDGFFTPYAMFRPYSGTGLLCAIFGETPARKTSDLRVTQDIVAAIMALDRCIRNEGQQQGSVYDERDMIVF